MCCVMILNYRIPPHLQPYEPVARAMREWTCARFETPAPDEVWLLEHRAVFTQGQAGNPEHVLVPGDIPVVPSDRGGQVTYHGPGFLMIYWMADLNRLKLGVRDWVRHLERMLCEYLRRYHAIEAQGCKTAPGVYVMGQKIASIGLRVRKQLSYHGICLNVCGDLSPFDRINPCGYQNLKMTQISGWDPSVCMDKVKQDLLATLAQSVPYTTVQRLGEVLPYV